jgi:hypothetical protein
MDYSPFLPGNRLRSPMVRPVAMVGGGEQAGDFHHRPLKLRTLVGRIYLQQI